MSNQIIKNESFDFENNDGLDLGEIISIVLRRKIIVGIFTIVSFAGGAIYSFSIPKLWEGNFRSTAWTKQNRPKSAVANLNSPPQLTGPDLNESNI